MTDRIVRRWYPLPQFTLYPSGLGLPAALKAELAAAQHRLLRSPHHPPPRRIDCNAATSSAVLFTAANPEPGNPRQPTTEPYVPPPDGYLRHLYEYLRSDTGVAGKITIRGRSRSTANGYRVYADGRLIGVAYPRPDNPAQWKNLTGLLVFVAADQARWISRAAPLGTKLRIIRPASPNS